MLRAAKFLPIIIAFVMIVTTASNVLGNTPTVSAAAASCAAGLVGTPPLCQPAPRANLYFPATTVINIKSLGAKGNGVTDDTAVIQKAITTYIGYGNHPHVLYFPAGTYLISSPLLWKDAKGNWNTFLTLQGQGRDQSIIRLKNSAAGFQNAAAPQAAVVTASRVDASSGSSNNGSGVDGQNNFILDITVDTGSSNAGANGISYLSNNLCALRDVMVKSDDGKGPIGIDMTRYATGPCMMDNVTVSGFGIGIDKAGFEYNVVFNHLTLLHQSVVGILDDNSVLSLQNFQSNNNVPALHVISRYCSPDALINIGTGTFINGSSSISAIMNDDGNLDLRAISTTGYKSAVSTGIPTTKAPCISGYKTVSGTNLAQYISPTPTDIWKTAQGPLNISGSDVPVLTDTTPADWADVAAYNAKGDGTTDDTAAIQKALNSNKPVVYLETGKVYKISATLQMNSPGQSLIGAFSLISTTGAKFASASSPTAMIQVTNPSRTNYIQQVILSASGSPGAIGIKDNGVGHLAVVDVETPNKAYTNSPGTAPGAMWIDDVDGGSWNFAQAQTVWARQLDSEGVAAPTVNVVNHGDVLWIMGMKTEEVTTAIQTTGGGQTELVGGLFYPLGTPPASLPLFSDNSAKLSASYASSAYSSSAHDFQLIVQSVQPGKSADILRSQLAGRGFGSVSPLIVDRP